ncbi:MarR family winged helix-turn-helix transcriptional regulator [Hoeflea ulvae]|uniref:MarR family transcriptional regulator n=1 Tax=Hoeflea ulvae TaxID=2983764 RepID=A0ABT3YJ83_9HYPH|nr:MarR family transcriptional regulator [Hoeflea ulvae]MCY0095968.1 MarR family transcriptional regulator [Hoeflea ulvae]
MQTEPHRLHFLLHSSALVEERLRLRLADLDIHPRQARVLDALDRMGKASQAELAREFDLTPASMSTMTARLLQAGYISRTSHPDEARSYVLALSGKGRDVLSEVYKAWSDIDRMIADTLGVEKAAQLAGLTHELRNALGGRGPGRAEKADRD